MRKSEYQRLMDKARLALERVNQVIISAEADEANGVIAGLVIRAEVIVQGDNAVAVKMVQTWLEHYADVAGNNEQVASIINVGIGDILNTILAAAAAIDPSAVGSIIRAGGGGGGEPAEANDPLERLVDHPQPSPSDRLLN
jgi:hypothetical protein